MKQFLFFLISGLLSLSSLIYAAEQGEYKHYVGFGISGSSDIEFANDALPQESGGGIFFVWDRFNSDNREALSLVFLDVSDYSGDHSLPNGGSIQRDMRFAGPSVVWKYFTESGFYVGGGLSLLSLSGESDSYIADSRTVIDATFDSDSSLTPTLVFGYRGLLSRFEESHLYIGVDWIRTLSEDVDFESSVTIDIDDDSDTIYLEESGTFEDLTISMVAVSIGWAW